MPLACAVAQLRATHVTDARALEAAPWVVAEKPAVAWLTRHM